MQFSSKCPEKIGMFILDERSSDHRWFDFERQGVALIQN